MNGLIQLYNWSRTYEMIDSQYGRITCLEWLEKEKIRIEKKPGRIARINEAGGQCALFVNDIRDSKHRIKE